jgi:hypothetical protein
MGIGISGYRNHWDYAEVYIIQTDQDGNFTPNQPLPLPDEPSISIFPNPSYNGLFTIKAINNPYQNISVFNISGQLVYTSAESASSFDLSNQANGLYFVSIQNKEGNIVHQQKVLLQQ